MNATQSNPLVPTHHDDGTALRRVTRRIRRSLLSAGYSREVYKMITEWRRGPIPRAPGGRACVNLSMDFELGLNGYFWRENEKRVADYAELALRNFPRVMDLLTRENVPINIQLATGLIDRDLAQAPIFNARQTVVIKANPHRFALDPSFIEQLRAPNVLLGVHGYSHRLFDHLSPEDAEWELERSITLFKHHFGAPPSFMSFPRNLACHEALLLHYGISSWRGASHRPNARHVLPRGLLLSPPSLPVEDLRRLLREVSTLSDAPLVHLWGHFTEGNASYMAQCLETIRVAGYTLIGWRGVSHEPLIGV